MVAIVIVIVICLCLMLLWELVEIWVNGQIDKKFYKYVGFERE